MSSNTVSDAISTHDNVTRVGSARLPIPVDRLNHHQTTVSEEPRGGKSSSQGNHHLTIPKTTKKEKETIMLAYDPEHQDDQKRQAWERLVSGAASGIICRTIAQPLDVIKIRFQLQVEPISRHSPPITAGAVHPPGKYTGISHTVRLMWREEGVRAFWKGLFASQLISIVYTPIQFTSFYYLTETSAKHLGTAPSSPLNHFLCGSLAGMIAIIAAHPFDTLRTRLVGQLESKKIYRSQLHAVNLIIRREGISGLYRGLLPNVALVGPQAGATFFGYEVCKQIWTKVFPIETKDGVMCNLTSGAVSGIFAKSLIYPLDSIKKRLQVQGFEEARKEFGRTRVYAGVVDCTIKVVREETFFGLYKGFLPSIYKAAAVTALNFAIFEYFVEKMQ